MINGIAGVNIIKDPTLLPFILIVSEDLYAPSYGLNVLLDKSLPTATIKCSPEVYEELQRRYPIKDG